MRAPGSIVFIQESHAGSGFIYDLMNVDIGQSQLVISFFQRRHLQYFFDLAAHPVIFLPDHTAVTGNSRIIRYHFRPDESFRGQFHGG